MKRSLLARLRTNGIAYILGALLLLLLSPLYQLLALGPLGYNLALSATTSGHFGIYVNWIHTHVFSFLLYRVQSLLAIVLLLSLPFTLFRVIVAQELVAQQEREAEVAAQEEDEEFDEEEAEDGDEEFDEDEVADEEFDGEEQNEENEEQADDDGMPPYAWRGKGFAVIAAWSGISGLVVYLLGSLASTCYLLLVSGTTPSADIGFWYVFFTIVTNTVGIGLLSLSTLFFGAMIARAGVRLWPPVWVFFGYTALVVAALFSGSAVAVASAPTSQAILTGPAILLFASWVLWLGVMLVRLKPEE